MPKKIVMLIAQKDFRDEEYFIPKDIFQQQSHEVITASTEKGQAVGVFGGTTEANLAFGDIKVGEFDAIVFVGGSGSMRDMDSKEVYKIAREAVSQNKVLGAICISPAILANAGVLKGKKATVWSSNMDKSAVKMLESGGCDYQTENVVIDGKIITANSQEQARKFSEKVLELLTPLHS